MNNELIQRARDSPEAYRDLLRSIIKNKDELREYYYDDEGGNVSHNTNEAYILFDDYDDFEKQVKLLKRHLIRLVY